MNGVEQRNHRTATKEIAASVEAIADAAARRMDELRDSIGAERSARLAMADEQRSYVNNEDRQLRQCCQERWNSTGGTTKKLADMICAFRDRGFWGRLNWFITGR